MSIDTINLWHKRARPLPTERDFNVQLGCHLEEVAEMLETLTFHVEGFASTPGEMTVLFAGLNLFADKLKSGETVVTINNRKDFLDSLADQIVTATGAGYCAGMNMTAAVGEVNRSNFSKFGSDGQPVRDANGKITKGPNYTPPNLRGMY